MRAVMVMAREQLGRDAAVTMKPYMVRFVLDSQAAEVAPVPSERAGDDAELAPTDWRDDDEGHYLDTERWADEYAALVQLYAPDVIARAPTAPAAPLF